MSFTKVNKVFEAVSLLSESFLFSGFQLIDNSFHLSVLNCFVHLRATFAGSHFFLLFVLRMSEGIIMDTVALLKFI